MIKPISLHHLGQVLQVVWESTQDRLDGRLKLDMNSATNHELRIGPILDVG